MRKVFWLLFALAVALYWVPFLHAQALPQSTLSVLPQSTLGVAFAPAPSLSREVGSEIDHASRLPATAPPDVSWGEDEESDGYAVAYHQAVRERRPLVLWVGVGDPETIRALPETIHYRLRSFRGDRGPLVIVARPERGVVLARFRRVPTALEVREVTRQPFGDAQRADNPQYQGVPQPLATTQAPAGHSSPIPRQPAKRAAPGRSRSGGACAS